MLLFNRPVLWGALRIWNVIKRLLFLENFRRRRVSRVFGANVRDERYPPAPSSLSSQLDVSFRRGLGVYVEHQQLSLLKGASQISAPPSLTLYPPCSPLWRRTGPRGPETSPQAGNWIKQHQSGHLFSVLLLCLGFLRNLPSFYIQHNWKWSEMREGWRGFSHLSAFNQHSLKVRLLWTLFFFFFFTKNWLSIL